MSIKGNALPYLLFGYGVATSPFSYMASKDQESTGVSASFIAVLLTQLSFLILILSYYFNWYPYSILFISSLMLVAAAFNTFIVSKSLDEIARSKGQRPI